MSTIQWIPKQAEKARLNDTVVAISVAASDPQNETPAGLSDETTPMTNHWYIYLETGPLTSIRADPTPTGLNPPMSMVLCAGAQDCEYRNAHKVVRMDVGKNLTVGTFFDLVRAKGYEKYQFTNNGNGCRYWVTCVVELLRNQGYLGDVDEATVALNTVWSDGKALGSGNQTRVDNLKGVFY